MGTGILVTRKLLNGQEWANTWGVSVGDSIGPITSAELQAIVLEAPATGYSEANTNPTAIGYDTAGDIIRAILAFERMIHFQPVQFVGFNLSDGSTPGQATGIYWSQNFNFQGLRALGTNDTVDSISPLSIALLVNRNVASLGVRPGRAYFRAALLDAAVRPGSRVGVQWTDQMSASTAASLIGQASSTSQLSNYVNTDPVTGSGPYLSVPSYSENGAGEQVVSMGYRISSLSVNKPVSRQLTRGRRRSVASGS